MTTTLQPGNPACSRTRAFAVLESYVHTKRNTDEGFTQGGPDRLPPLFLKTIE